MIEAVLPDRRRAAIAYARGEDVASPRPVKLTIDDLVSLDREWSQEDRYYSTELIDGCIYHTPARLRPRAWLAGQLFMRLRTALEGHPSEFTVLTRGSIAMPPYDLPLPDIVLTSEPDGEGFIPLSSVPLILEVAESGLDFFLGDKHLCYARHGVPEYWVVNVDASVIHQMWNPMEAIYSERREVKFGEPISAATIPDLRVETAGL